MVEHYLAKVGIRVRFSVPAQYKIAPKGAILYCAGKQECRDALARESKRGHVTIDYSMKRSCGMLKRKSPS